MQYPASSLSGMGVYVTEAQATPFQILGFKEQVVSVSLAPGQVMAGEPGTLCLMSDNIKLKVRSGGLLGGVRNMLSGESFFRLTYRNESNVPGFVGVTPNLPGTVIPIDMSMFPAGLLCKRGAYFASVDLNTQLSISLQRARSCFACLFSGLTFVLQKIQGGSWAFLCAHGTIMTKTLRPGETIVCATDSVVALEPTVEVDVKCLGCCWNACFMGEGMCNTTLTGPGTIYLSSLPIEKLRKLFWRPQPKRKGRGGAPPPGN